LPTAPLLCANSGHWWASLWGSRHSLGWLAHGQTLSQKKYVLHMANHGADVVDWSKGSPPHS
jgi:hypothetical protein